MFNAFVTRCTLFVPIPAEVELSPSEKESLRRPFVQFMDILKRIMARVHKKSSSPYVIELTGGRTSPACPPGLGLTSLADGECVPCPRAYYRGDDSTALCRPCPAGHYASRSGAAGSPPTESGAKYCRPCPAGHVCDGSLMTRCVNGSFPSLSGRADSPSAPYGAVFCVLCPHGYTCNGFSKLPSEPATAPGAASVNPMAESGPASGADSAELSVPQSADRLEPSGERVRGHSSATADGQELLADAMPAEERRSLPA